MVAAPLAPAPLDRRELSRYARRLQDRWPLERALLGGACVADHADPPAGAQRERGPEFVLILVSAFFDGVPWLERVTRAGALWDAGAMGGPVDVHCYTPAELERRRTSVKAVRDALRVGVDLLATA